MVRNSPKAAKPFRKERDTYRLVWEDENHRLNGLEIFAKTLRFGAHERLMLLWGRSSAADTPLESRARALTELREELGKRLISWNYEDEDGVNGELLPCTADGLANLERDEFYAILNAYLEAAAGVSGPLDESSDSGDMSEVELPPMDDL